MRVVPVTQSALLVCIEISDPELTIFGKVVSGIMRHSRAPRLIDFKILITYLLAFYTR